MFIYDIHTCTRVHGPMPKPRAKPGPELVHFQCPRPSRPYNMQPANVGEGGIKCYSRQIIKLYRKSRTRENPNQDSTYILLCIFTILPTT